MIFNKTGVYIFFIALFYVCFFFSCSKKIITDKHSDSVVGHTNENGIKKEYLKEGFINSGLFRVVILSCSSEPDSNVDDLKDKARKRALTTLQNYMRQKGKNVTNNVRAELLNFINYNSVFKKVIVNHKKNGVYYLDIYKPDMKRFLENIPSY